MKPFQAYPIPRNAIYAALKIYIDIQNILQMFPISFLLAFFSVSPAFTTKTLAKSQLSALTASLIAGKYSASPVHNCGPKMTCLNCVRFGIYNQLVCGKHSERSTYTTSRFQIQQVRFEVCHPVIMALSMRSPSTGLKSSTLHQVIFPIIFPLLESLRLIVKL